MKTTILHNVKTALAEDLGSGDISAKLIPADKKISAYLINREPMVLCGCAWFEQTFSQLDADITVTWNYADGDKIIKNAQVCQISGAARAVLSAERTALNFLQTLSATATLTARFVDKVKGTNVKILDTRKTIPGLRIAQKYAVKTGGGVNHRFGLYDAYLIKENHIAACGSLTQAIKIARRLDGGKKLEVEVETLDDLQIALDENVEQVLLDNFSIDMLEKAVVLDRGNSKLEISGNVDIHNVRIYADIGVDYISIGGLTKNVDAVDLSLLVG